MSLAVMVIFLAWIETTRDIIIIIWGILGIIFFLAGIALLYFTYRLGRGAVDRASNIVDENVKPVLGTVQTTAEGARGTASYISERVVSPIVRVTAFAAGVRRGASVFTGALRRTRRRRR